MPVDTTGFGANSAEAAIQNIIESGATVHLLGGAETADYNDTAADIEDKSDAEISVEEGDFTITTPDDYSGVATLENDNDLEYGQLSIGVVDDIVIQNDVNGDLWIVGDEPVDPELTGEQVTLPAGTVLYELGNPE